jgi:hypothetical protein
VQVCGEGGIGIGAGVDGAIVIVVQGDCDPFGSGELLFQEMSNGHLLLSGEGGGTLACTGLSQGFPCSSYGEDESLLLSLRDSRGYDIILLPLGGGGSLLLIDGGVGRVARHGWQDGRG